VSVAPARWCNHYHYVWSLSAPALMMGRCEHDMSCPVCGYGWSTIPDPCDVSRQGLTSPPTRSQKDKA